MKILELKIISQNNDIIRELKFDKNFSIIYGDILAPENDKGTSNSLGKSLLLKFVDYIYGANEDAKIVPKDIHGYRLEANVEFNSVNYLIKRTLGNSKITINNEEYELNKYKKFFAIDRNIFHMQILLSKRSELYSKGHPVKEEVLSVLKLLKLNNLVDEISDIYKAQDYIKDLKKTAKQYKEAFNKTENSSNIEEMVFNLNKEIEKLEIDLEKVSTKMSTLEISGMRNEIMEEYSNKNSLLKKEKTEYEFCLIEKQRLEKFIEDANKADVSVKAVKLIFDKANFEISELVVKKLSEAEEFHKKIFEDRKEFISSKLKNLEDESLKKEKSIVIQEKELDKLGKIISENKVYQESIAIYDDGRKKLQDKKYLQGKFSQLSENIDTQKNEDYKLTSLFNSSSLKIKEYNNKIDLLREFIFDLTQEIYGESQKEITDSFLEIKIRDKHQKNRPFSMDVTIKGDAGEGIKEVKKVIIDILFFKFNDVLDFLFQDSSCYTGIDPRQVRNLIKKILEISTEINKQVIISINRYQLYNEDENHDTKKEIEEIVENYSVITLSEKEKLLKFDF